MKKKRLKIKKLILFILIVLIILILLVLFNHKNNKDLKSIGYNELEISSIEKLTKSEINEIRKYKYNKNIIYIIESENYNPNKIKYYLKGINENKKIDYLKIFNLINDDEFKENNFDIYLNLLNKYDNYKGILKYVNDYSSNNIKLDNTTLSFIEQEYFIIDYLDRYINYYNDNKNLDFKEIVTRVNSNLDYKFYDDSKEADLSKGMYTLVNKFYYLGKDYVPDDLEVIDGIYARDSAKAVKVAATTFKKMADDARNEGLTIKVTTGYRSYNFQSTLYNNYVKIDGVKEADTYSARPGYSEHQTGFTLDLTNAKNVGFRDFDKTKEYEWLSKNAYKYGFIQRYPKDKEYLTGYMYESWHYRYVGDDIAKYIYENNLTYEEYYAYFKR